MQSAMRSSRRTFLRQASLAGLAVPFFTRHLLSAPPSELVRHASFGASGQAFADLEAITRHPAIRLVAVADVDLDRMAEVKKKFPDARVYQDWRELLEWEKELDSVNVSVPDHMHAPIAMSAMQLGKHVYCEKPLTHDIYETRQLTLYARQHRLVSQMGIQIHSASEYRLAVRLIHDLAIGKVREVHTWSGKKWGDMTPRPTRTDPVPPNFNWDQWQGVVAPRPFIGLVSMATRSALSLSNPARRASSMLLHSISRAARCTTIWLRNNCSVLLAHSGSPAPRRSTADQRRSHPVRSTASASETPASFCISTTSANCEGGTLGRPMPSAYNAAKSSSRNSRGAASASCAWNEPGLSAWGKRLPTSLSASCPVSLPSISLRVLQHIRVHMYTIL